MKTNIDKNIEQHSDSKYSNGWVYFIFLIGLIAVMVAISFVAKWLLK